MRTFEKVFTTEKKLWIPENTEKFIRESETKFESIESYLKMRPRVLLPLETEKSVVVCKINKQINFNDSVEFIESEKGIFPNAEGLTIAKFLLRGKVPENKAVYGFDKKENLWDPWQEESLFIPFISNKKTNFYFGLSSFSKTSFSAKTEGSYLIYFSN